MATQRFAPQLMQIVLRAGNSGATLSAAARAMAAKQGFTKALRDERMTFRQFADAHDFRVESKGAASRVFAPRQTPPDDATLMCYAT